VARFDQWPQRVEDLVRAFFMRQMAQRRQRVQAGLWQQRGQALRL
jgi:hypothetical protein